MYTQFLDLIHKRYSCRNFLHDEVNDAQISGVVEAARLAPSACNRQPWTFVAVRDKATRMRILAKSRPAFLDAPVVIVACGHHDEAWHRPSDSKDHTDVDVAIAVEHMCLAATSMGLATCWVCSFDTDATREALGLPADVEPIALLPLGYSADSEPAPAKTRKNIDDVLRLEKY